MKPGTIIRNLGLMIADISRLPLRLVYNKYRDFTMIPEESYVKNLALARQFKHVAGSVVECGVWKGGMSAGLAEILGPDRYYYLFDSFEGCPKAKEIDGPKAIQWQQDTGSPHYYNNSSADISFSQEMMQRAGANRCTIIKGLFDNTLPEFKAEGGIAILRLDGDWYGSTMTCLEYLFPQVNEGGVIIIDDYYVFDGCARAVHDYLSRNRIAPRIHQLENDVCFLVKS